MPRNLGVIALNPPTGATKASVEILDAPVSLPLPNAGDKVGFPSKIEVDDGDVFSFSIETTLDVSSLNLLPRGWLGGNCPPTIVINLGDFGTGTLDRLQLDYKQGVANKCKKLSCHFHGTGLLTCSGKGITMTMDLTSPTNLAGVYLAVETDGGATNAAQLTYADLKLPPLQF